MKPEELKSKLKELNHKRYIAQCEVDSIKREIEVVRKQILDSNIEDYKGKWFCKKETSYDDDDFVYTVYEIVHVIDVLMECGDFYLSVIIINTDNHSRPEHFNLEWDGNYYIGGLRGMKEMTTAEFEDLDYSIEILLDCLSAIRPELNIKHQRP